MNFTAENNEEILIAGDEVVAYLPTYKTWWRDEEFKQQIWRGYDGEKIIRSDSTASIGEKDLAFVDMTRQTLNPRMNLNKRKLYAKRIWH